MQQILFDINGRISALITFRKIINQDTGLSELSETYSNWESRGLSLNSFICTFTVGSVMLGNILIPFNKYRLAFSFYIPQLPFDSTGISANWILNYFYQATTHAFAAYFFMLYFPLTLVFMNHCCWGLDTLLYYVNEIELTISFNNRYNVEDNLHRNASIRSKMEKLIDMSYRVIQWKNDIQGFMQFSFLAEFSLMSSLFCTCIFTLITNPLECVVTLMVMILCMWQFYLYCWMGNRIIVRIERLAVALYDTDWHLIDARDQKDLQLILVMAQQLKGFDGIFRPLNMQTFQKV